MALSALAIGLIALSAGMTVMSAMANNAAIAAEAKRKSNLAKLKQSTQSTKLKYELAKYNKRLALMTSAQGVATAGTPLLLGEEAEKEYEKNINAVHRTTLYNIWGAKSDAKNKRMANWINMGSNLAQVGVMAYTGWQSSEKAALGINPSTSNSQLNSRRYTITSN